MLAARRQKQIICIHNRRGGQAVSKIYAYKYYQLVSMPEQGTFTTGWLREAFSSASEDLQRGCQNYGRASLHLNLSGGKYMT